MMSDAAPVASTPYCADLSRQLEEPMAGTAIHVKTWFLLEYPFSWTARATEDNDLPRPIQLWLDAQVAALPDSRLQFIRRPRTSAGFSFFVALAGETTSQLYRFDLSSYEALPEVDLTSMLAGEPDDRAVLSTDPLYLVCVNGRRDRCCARYGAALFQALATHAGEAVWQTTHLGGHRFAPTLLTLPDGMLHGRLTPAEAESFVVARRREQLSPAHLRGRTSYESVAQAAEIWLRRETGETGLGDYRLLDVEKLSEDEWTVQFDAPAAGRIHRLHMRRDPLNLAVHASCGVPQKKPLFEYRLLTHLTS